MISSVRSTDRTLTRPQVRMPHRRTFGEEQRCDHVVPRKGPQGKIRRENEHGLHGLDIVVLRGSSERYGPCRIFERLSPGQTSGRSRIFHGQGSRMPIGLTVNVGNILDVTHFEDTLMQSLPEGAMIVFDNGAYGRKNSGLLDSPGLGFVTRLQSNASDYAFVKAHPDDRGETDNVQFMRTKGDIGRARSYSAIRSFARVSCTVTAARRNGTGTRCISRRGTPISERGLAKSTATGTAPLTPAHRICSRRGERTGKRLWRRPRTG